MCGPGICVQTMTDEENDELSEITAVVLTRRKSSALQGDADRDETRRTRLQNYVEIVVHLYSVDDFKSHFRLNREATSFTLIPSSIFIVRSLLTLFELFVLLSVNLFTNHVQSCTHFTVGFTILHVAYIILTDIF